MQRAWPVPPPTLSRTPFIPSSQVCNFSKPCSKDKGNTLCRSLAQPETLQSRSLASIRPRQISVLSMRPRLSARSGILPGTTPLKQVPQAAREWTCGCVKLHSALVWRGNAAASFILAGLSGPMPDATLGLAPAEDPAGQQTAAWGINAHMFAGNDVRPLVHLGASSDLGHQPRAWVWSLMPQSVRPVADQRSALRCLGRSRPG